MQFTAKQISGFMVQRDDEMLGVLRDLFFDLTSWSVRFLVVETGAWPDSRRVLLQPRQVSRLDLREKRFITRLTRPELDACPLERSHPSVSQQHAIRLAGAPAPQRHWAADSPDETVVESDPNLASAQRIVGYSVRGVCGCAGRVADVEIETPDDHFDPKVKAFRALSLWGWGTREPIPNVAVTQVDWQQRRVLVDPASSMVPE